MSDQHANPPQHIPYEVLSQHHGEELTAAGHFEPMWTVTFKGHTGTIASIKVPDREYTGANVDRLIQEKLDRVMDVHGLGPEPHPENLA